MEELYCQLNEQITVVKPHAILETPLEWIRDYAQLLERYGRTCYKSEEKTKDGSAEPFVRRVIKSGHESVIEHLVITYKIICSRSCSHQLVRHRIAAFSQESMRYCDYTNESKFQGLQVVLPESFEGSTTKSALFVHSVTRAYEEYKLARQLGVLPEDARFLLPNAAKTEVETTFNLRQWRHVIRERGLNAHAQWEIRGIFKSILSELTILLPCVFGDLNEPKVLE